MPDPTHERRAGGWERQRGVHCLSRLVQGAGLQVGAVGFKVFLAALRDGGIFSRISLADDERFEMRRLDTL